MRHAGQAKQRFKHDSSRIEGAHQFNGEASRAVEQRGHVGHTARDRGGIRAANINGTLILTVVAIVAKHSIPIVVTSIDLPTDPGTLTGTSTNTNTGTGTG